MTTLVRAAEQRDVPRLSALDRLCFPTGNERWSESSWADELTAPDRVVEVAEVDGLVAAAATFRSDDELAELVKVLVDPDFRRRGLARELIQAGVHRARQDGLTRVLLEVRDDNVGAATLYADLGFAAVGLRKNYYGAGADALVLQLTLLETSLLETTPLETKDATHE